MSMVWTTLILVLTHLVANILAEELTTTYGRLLMVPRRKKAVWKYRQRAKIGREAVNGTLNRGIVMPARSILCGMSHTICYGHASCLFIVNL